MAVQYVKSGGGIGNLLGGLATIGGALTDQPWLTGIGQGLGMMSGGNSGIGGNQNSVGIGKILDGIVCGGWYNLAEGNLGKTDSGLGFSDFIRKILGRK